MQRAFYATRGEMSAYRASKQLSVPASTLRDKINGKVETNATVGHKTIFSEQEEKKLHSYYLHGRNRVWKQLEIHTVNGKRLQLLWVKHLKTRTDKS